LEEGERKDGMEIGRKGKDRINWRVGGRGKKRLNVGWEEGETRIK